MKRINSLFVFPAVLAFILILVPFVSAQESPFEKEIAAYEKMQRDNPVEPGGTVFVGSSTWRLWKGIEKDFEQFQAVNRGFGGSKIPEQIAAHERIVLPLKPKRIVFFCGTNDLAAKTDSVKVYENFIRYLSLVWKHDPALEIYFVSASRAPVRKEYWANGDIFNAKLKDLAEKATGLHYIDVVSAMNDEKGETREDLFIADRLHLNRTAQELWIPIITKAIEKESDREKIVANPDSIRAERVKLGIFVE